MGNDQVNKTENQVDIGQVIFLSLPESGLSISNNEFLKEAEGKIITRYPVSDIKSIELKQKLDLTNLKYAAFMGLTGIVFFARINVTWIRYSLLAVFSILALLMFLLGALKLQIILTTTYGETQFDITEKPSTAQMFVDSVKNLINTGRISINGEIRKVDSE